MDFSSVMSGSALTANSLARRVAPTTPQSCAASGVGRNGGGDSRSGNAVPSAAVVSDIGGAGSAASLSTGSGDSRPLHHSSPTASSASLSPTASSLAPATPSVRSGLSARLQAVVEVDEPRLLSHRQAPQPLNTVDYSGAHLPTSPWSVASSASTLAVHPQALPSRDEDEHDRAVAAFLRENGFTTLTKARRQSLVGATYPLHCAASQGLVRMTDLLIKAGADPGQKNSWGQKALDVAGRCNRKGSHDGVLDVLRRATAAAAA